MIKKISGLIVLMMMIGVGGVMGAEQNVGVNVSEGNVIDFSVNNISYGPVLPESFSNVMNSIIIVGAANNANLAIFISVANPVGNVFQNIIFDLDNNGFTDEVIIGDRTLTKNIVDTDGEFLVTIPTRLKVPSGTSAGIKTGVINYVVMG